MKTRLTDAEYAEQIRASQESALQALFDAYAEPLLDFAFGYVGDVQVCEDIVQEVFVRVWRTRTRLNPELSLKAYLYRSVRNQALKYLRHEKVEREAEGYLQSLYYHPDTPTPEDELRHAELTVLLDRTIRELPAGCRTIFLMSRFDGLTYSEIAHILDISINTVKTQMGRALAALRKNLLSER
ncbi:MAG: RNA polymerase sigma-70 factor [Fidelibacterota bacterium]|nr:MAG: RNA polymerase sigma-70 factor [Candidatus Neomarinimicrobiota bacterium]